jgi:aspartate aminotransferase-like enzyme
VIYPGKVSDADCFRIGTIGHIFPEDLKALVAAVRQTLTDMQIDSAKSAHAASPDHHLPTEALSASPQ